MRTRTNESGQILLLAALAVPILIGFVGLAIDVGNIQVTRRQAQAAADAAAMAGAQEILLESGGSAGSPCNPNAGTPVAINNAGQDSATQNGFRNGVGGVVVNVNCPPSLGPNSSSNNAVEVIVTKSQSTFFMGLLGAPTTNIGARAVGILGQSSVCIQVTGPVGEGIDIDGGFILNAPTCSILINSVNTKDNGNGDQSITTHGGDCKGGGGDPYQPPTSGTSQVVSNWIGTAAAYYAQGVCTTPQPTFGVQPQPDLLGYLPQPSSSDYAKCGRWPGPGVDKITTSTTLNPGSYCGGIWITSGATVTLNPGTYYLYGGNTMIDGRHSLEVDGGATLTDFGKGVTIFNTGLHSPYGVNNPSSSYWASIELCTTTGPNPKCAAEATVSLTAPTTGTYAGILFFDARALADGTPPCGGTDSVHETCAKNQTYMQSFLGGTNQTFAGTFYFPTTLLWFSGGPGKTMGNCSPFIGWILLWNIPGPFQSDGSGGGLTVNANCGSLTGGNPLKTAALGE